MCETVNVCCTILLMGFITVKKKQIDRAIVVDCAKVQITANLNFCHNLKLVPDKVPIVIVNLCPAQNYCLRSEKKMKDSVKQFTLVEDFTRNVKQITGYTSSPI